MSDEFDIIDDDEEQTLVLDDNEMDIEGEENFSADVEEDENFDDEEAYEDLRPGGYRPDSNIYSAMLVLSFVAYSVALTIVLIEMKNYCIHSEFMWGMLK